MSELFQAFAGKHLSVSYGFDAHLRKTFPGCDLHEQYLLADLWLEANPRLRWRNQPRGLANWLTKNLRHAPKAAAEAKVGTVDPDRSILCNLCFRRLMPRDFATHECEGAK